MATAGTVLQQHSPQPAGSEPGSAVCSLQLCIFLRVRAEQEPISHWVSCPRTGQHGHLWFPCHTVTSSPAALALLLPGSPHNGRRFCSTSLISPGFIPNSLLFSAFLSSRTAAESSSHSCTQLKPSLRVCHSSLLSALHLQPSSRDVPPLRALGDIHCPFPQLSTCSGDVLLRARQILMLSCSTLFPYRQIRISILFCNEMQQTPLYLGHWQR